MRNLLPRFVDSILSGAGHAALYGPAIDTVVVTGTAINTTITAGTVASGDSLQIKNYATQTPARLLTAWSDHQAAGYVRIRSPKFHDNIDGVRWRAQIGVLDPQLPLGFGQPLYAQDTLTVELSGSATAGDIESVVMMNYYADLPGQAARFIDWPTVLQRGQNLIGQRIAMTIGSTAGYNGARAINADTDYLKANLDYAVLGMTTDTETAAITIRGTDTGNLRIPVPGEPGLVHHTGYWFRRLSMHFGIPLIPVINSANKGNTQIEVVGDENGGTANVVIYLAELK